MVSHELKEYAKLLKKVQPYLERGYVPYYVDLFSWTIGLENPNAPRRYRNKHIKMSEREFNFFDELSNAIAFRYPEDVFYDILMRYSDILVMVR